MPQAPIPSLDPIPLPAPYWLFKVLLIVTFTLHILAMNALLGGMALAIATRWSSARDRANRLFSDVATKLPLLLPATVTVGVAPLLFLQVIYGQFFYTSSVVIAWPWFLALVMLTIAYYGLYAVSSRAHRQAGAGRWVLLASFLLIVVVGFLFTTNLTLSQTPAVWSGKYYADSSGWNLNLSEPTLVPRYLHFFAAAVAVGGLLLILIAWLKRNSDLEYRRYIFRFGGRAFEYATMAQFAVGLWFLATLPSAQRTLFMGGSSTATLLLITGIVAAVAAMVLVGRALRNDAYGLGAIGGAGLTTLSVVAMIVMRDILRDDYLKPYFHPERFIVQTQWTVLPLFLLVFVGGVALWLVMLKRYPFTAPLKSGASWPEMR